MNNMNKHNNHSFLLNGQMPKLTGCSLYYARISKYCGGGVDVRKLKVRLDMVIYNQNTNEEMRQLTFLGFNVKIPSNNNSLSFMIDNNSILATNKQDVANFIKKYFISKNDRTLAITQYKPYETTNKEYYLKQALELLKKL